jgi:hypothetical protein
MPRTALPAALLLAALAAAPGCSAKLFSEQPQPSTEEGAWAAERDLHTRSAKVYDQLDDVAFATATYLPASVREARAERLAVWKGLNPAEREAAVQAAALEGADSEEFLLAFFCAERQANDLATDRSTWRVTLMIPVAGGVEQAPASKVESLRADPTLRMLYPYVTDFDHVYRVRFPRYPGGRPLDGQPFVLRIAGALGKVDLDFTPRTPKR